MSNLRDEISKEISRMESEMERIFRHFSTFRTSFSSSPLPHPWRPFTDAYETQSHLVVNVELAGVKKEELEIFTEEDTLIIRGVRREAPHEGKISYRQMEINYGPFEVIISLMIPIDEKKGIKATLKDGILQIKLPKAKEGKVQHIKINVEEE
ncbi:MAG TPA: Hsp20/alpha crystallin family protein [Candidatus Omnitrophica bacterium]|nr:Hsp20/alpha crystallin family protein [Candidatus Omnitrophota bacterium]